MEKIIVFFENMGYRIVPAIITLVFVLVCCLIAKLFVAGRKGKRKDKFENVFFENSDNAYIIFLKSSNMPVYANKQLKEFVGIEKEELIEDYEALNEIFSYEDLEKYKSLYSQWDRKSVLKFMFLCQKTNKWLELKMFYDKEQKYEIMSFNDISAYIEKRQELLNELDRAYEISRMKTEFLSKMSHDIRTPMNGILGMLSLMKINLAQGKNISQYIEKTESLSQFLINLINDILDISRIEVGKMTLSNEVFDFRELAKKIDNMFRKTIEEKGIEFKVDYTDIKNPYVIGDEFRILKIITNFISNAIKFTDKGEIQLRLAQVSSDTDKGSYLISVKDTGKGIEPEFIKNLFKPFEQEDSKIAKKYGGSGLGMAIADQLAHLMNGEIIADSVVGKGSTFTVYINLPIGEAIEEKKEKEVPKNINSSFSWQDRRILLAEDNTINAEIFVEMLELEGASIDVAEDGAAVIDKFKQMGKGYYDIILMDIQMPVKNGWEAAMDIRKLKDIGGDTIPIFALSADAFVEDKRKSVVAGMNGHISKPINYNELRNEASKVIR